MSDDASRCQLAAIECPCCESLVSRPLQDVQTITECPTCRARWDWSSESSPSIRKLNRWQCYVWTMRWRIGETVRWLFIIIWTLPGVWLTNWFLSSPENKDTLEAVGLTVVYFTFLLAWWLFWRSTLWERERRKRHRVSLKASDLESRRVSGEVKGFTIRGESGEYVFKDDLLSTAIEKASNEVSRVNYTRKSRAERLVLIKLPREFGMAIVVDPKAPPVSNEEQIEVLRFDQPRRNWPEEILLGATNVVMFFCALVVSGIVLMLIAALLELFGVDSSWVNAAGRVLGVGS